MTLYSHLMPCLRTRVVSNFREDLVYFERELGNSDFFRKFAANF